MSHVALVQDGHLEHKDIRVIWKKYPKALHNWLLHLTEVFDLTFPLADQPTNIVPCLLPQVEPEVLSTFMCLHWNIFCAFLW